MLNLDNNVLNSGGAISLQSGTAFPNGHVYGRFFNDTNASTLYFDDGTTWNAIGGGGGTPTLDQVLTAGNVTSQGMIAGNYNSYTANTQFSKNSTTTNGDDIGATFVHSASYQLFGSFFDQNKSAGQLINISFFTQPNAVANANGGAFTGSLMRLFINAGANSTLNLNNVQIRTGLYRTEKTFVAGAGSTIFLQYFNDYIVGGDAFNGNLGQMTIFRRIGIYIQDFISQNITYNNLWSIYSEVDAPMYNRGIGFFGTLTNLATTNVALSLGKPINFENAVSNTAGGNTGQHLIVYINGVQRKIALLNP